MQYMRTDEDKRKLSDRQVKQAAHARMRRRQLKKLVWFCAIIAVLAAVWFGFAKAPVTAYFSQQKDASLQTAEGLKRTGTMIDRRNIVNQAEQENSTNAPASKTSK